MIEGFLDTNILIDLLRDNDVTVTWYSSLREQRLGIIPIVWMELLQGARNKHEQRIILDLLRGFQLEHPTPADNNWAMRQVADFHLSHSVRFQDAMIASVAVRFDVPLYTFNIKHFAPLPNLDVRRPY